MTSRGSDRKWGCIAIACYAGQIAIACCARVPAQAWVTLIVGGLATVGVVATWQQKNRADRRSEWWRRTQWAFERTLSSNDIEAQLGWKMLAILMGSTLATRDDSGVIQLIAQHAVLDANGQGE